jgi:hypothetical protein
MDAIERFYVYRIYNDRNETLYIGKGSGPRIKNQARRFSAKGEVLEYFKSEKRCYRREVELIAELKPALNVHPGGNGSRAIPKPHGRKAAWEIEMEAIGPRVYAARALLKKGEAALLRYVDASKIEQLRRVANGPWC